MTRSKLIAAGEEMTANFVETLNSMLPVESTKGCTCAAKSGVIGHAAFCPLGDGTAPEANGR